MKERVTMRCFVEPDGSEATVLVDSTKIKISLTTRQDQCDTVVVKLDEGSLIIEPCVSNKILLRVRR